MTATKSTATNTKLTGLLEITPPDKEEGVGFFYHLCVLDVNITPGMPFKSRTLAVQHANRIANELGIEIGKVIDEPGYTPKSIQNKKG